MYIPLIPICLELCPKTTKVSCTVLDQNLKLLMININVNDKDVYMNQKEKKIYWCLYL